MCDSIYVCVEWSVFPRYTVSTLYTPVFSKLSRISSMHSTMMKMRMNQSLDSQCARFHIPRHHKS